MSARSLIEVTDLVEFLQRRESVSGVQRVIAESTPLLLDRLPGAGAVVLDRPRGVFVELTPSEVQTLLRSGASSTALGSVDPDALAAAATACLDRAGVAAAARIDADVVMVYLGAVWINDALMVATRDAHARGARSVYLLYDLTPVLAAGHTAAVNRLFERYLTLVTQTASRVPAISVSSRSDYEAYCSERGWNAPPGAPTGLPCGLSPDLAPDAAADPSPWPRPYALFVGTVEARKNHLLALAAWRQLMQRRDPAAVPDLVCIGRLGWHATEFLRDYTESGGLGGKVSVLSTSVSDADLARFYAHAEFTVYPSRYEGWGLPVSESLAFGKVAVVADNSSLREAGRDLAVYFATDNVEAFVGAVEAAGLDLEYRARLEQRIAVEGADPNTWSQVAAILEQEVAMAASADPIQPVPPGVELGREYMLAVAPPAPDAGFADQYAAYLSAEGLTPLLRQPRGERDFEIVDSAVVGTFGAPQAWGNEVRPGRRVDVRVIRPCDGPLTLLLSTRSMPGVVTIDAVGPGGPVREDVYLGSVVSLPLGDGSAGEPAQVSITVLDAADSIEGFLGIRSFVVLRSDDLTTQVVAHRAAAEALRQELDFVTNTRSWKVTAPLRRWKGRGTG